MEAEATRVAYQIPEVDRTIHITWRASPEVLRKARMETEATHTAYMACEQGAKWPAWRQR